MANLKEDNTWEQGIYQFETSDPVMGGPNGIDNVPTRQLANRTLWLKTELAAAVQSAGNQDIDGVKTFAVRQNFASGLQAASSKTDFDAGSRITLGANTNDAWIKNETSGKFFALKNSGELHYGGHKVYTAEYKPSWTNDITNKPTTVAASGLTDAATKTDVSNAATAVKNEILGGAGAAFDTLKELAAALQNKSDKGHTHRAAEISDFAEAVATLTVHQKIGTFDICKLPDGTQIESGTVRIQNHNNNPTARVLTWPLAFVDAPVVVATASGHEVNVRDIWVTIDNMQSNQSALHYWLHEPAYNTPDATVNFVAIGRWK